MHPGVDALGTLEGDSLGDDVLVLYFDFELVDLVLDEGAKVGLHRVDLGKGEVTRISLWSLSLRSACTIIVRR